MDHDSISSGHTKNNDLSLISGVLLGFEIGNKTVAPLFSGFANHWNDCNEAERWNDWNGPSLNVLNGA